MNVPERSTYDVIEHQSGALPVGVWAVVRFYAYGVTGVQTIENDGRIYRNGAPEWYFSANAWHRGTLALQPCAHAETWRVWQDVIGVDHTPKSDATTWQVWIECTA